jgi:hypothetical protein
VEKTHRDDGRNKMQHASARRDVGCSSTMKTVRRLMGIDGIITGL